MRRLDQRTDYRHRSGNAIAALPRQASVPHRERAAGDRVDLVGPAPLGPAMLAAAERPFRTTGGDGPAHVLDAWRRRRRRVKSDDTIICLGDVAHHAAFGSGSLRQELRNYPGKRMLVLGNHDVNLDRRPAGGECHGPAGGSAVRPPPSGRRASSSSATRAPRSAARARASPRSTGTP